MKLQEVVKLNDEMMPKAITSITIVVAAAAWAMIVIDMRSYIGIAVAVTAMILCIIMAYIPLKHLFSKSLFGEDAYRYMILPISFKEWTLAKIYSGTKACFASMLILMVCADYYMIMIFGAGGSELRVITSTSAAAIINAHSVMSDNIITTNSVIFIITAAPFAVLIDSVFVSAIIMCGVIIYNSFDSRREKPQLAIGIAIAAIVFYATTNFLFVWAPGLFFKNDLAIPQLIIAAGLKTGAIYGLARSAAYLLEKKYSLN